jgi:hypothetical protein
VDFDGNSHSGGHYDTSIHREVLQHKTALSTQVTENVLKSAKTLCSFKYADKYKIRSYRKLIEPVRKFNRGLPKAQMLERHHLIEKRFSEKFNVNEKDMLCIVLTKSEHKVFTDEWRKRFPYKEGTEDISPEEILKAAREIYEDYPAILVALGL